MISYLKGRIKHQAKNHLIVEAGNIGYQVYTTPFLIAEKKIGEEIELYTHQHVREDRLDLFGFLTHKELEIFEKLISISGVGPKTGLGVLTVNKPDDVLKGIELGDEKIFTRVPGIGNKTAQRIILELKGKLENIGESAISKEDEEVIEALVSLGYKKNDVRRALDKVEVSVEDSAARIRAALKMLGGTGRQNTNF